MGLLGAIAGSGRALETVGNMGVTNAFQSMRDEAQAEREKVIAKYRQGLDDKSWESRNDITSKQEGDAALQQSRDRETEQAAGHQYRMEEIGATGKESRKTEEAKADAKSLKANEVITKNDKVMTEQALQGEYDRQWGKYDAMNTLIGYKQDSPRYEEWRNDNVKPEYRRSFEGAKSSDYAAELLQRAKEKSKSTDNVKTAPNTGIINRN